MSEADPISHWAVLVEQLIAAGHPDPLSYTPSQAVAFAELASKRRLRELQDSYTIARVAAHGDKEADKLMRKVFNDGA